MERTNLKAILSLYGPEWTGIKRWLGEERDYRIAQLLKAKTWEDSLKHQGAVEVIDKLLNVEKDAAIAASTRETK